MGVFVPLVFTLFVCICPFLLAHGAFVGITQTPFATNDSLFIHVHSEIPDVKTPSQYWGIIQRPYPTNSWFANLGFTTNFPVTAYPYLIAPLLTGVTVCYPILVEVPTAYTSSWHNDIIFWIDGVGNRTIDSYTMLGVTTLWPAIVPNGPSLRVPFVAGHPYVTLMFNSSEFNISTDSRIVTVNDAAPSGCIVGSKFRIGILDPSTTNAQTWLLYTLTGDIKLCYVPNGHIDPLGVHDIFQGSSSNVYNVLRLAMLTKNGIPYESIFDTYVPNIVVGGDVSVPEQIGSDNTAIIKFTWHAIDYNGNPSSTNNILMMGLPHHEDCINKSKLVQSGLLMNVYSTVKGALIGYVGSQWSLVEKTTDLGWYSRFPMDPNKVETVRAALIKEASNFIPHEWDTYGNGKYVAALARLVLIAEELNENTLVTQLVENLKSKLGPWLYRVTYRATFLYDVTWGGTISADGWLDPGRDYSNGIYNDHHFHNGYYIYAGAVVLKHDPNWEWGSRLIDLTRDIANPSTADPFFPITRHKDWYCGHSWAEGLTSTMDGKNQESTSEAVNAYYAIVLYGMAIQNDLIKNIGKILLATEIRSSQKYWHITPNNNIYPPVFSLNGIVGIVWSDKADYRTFFGPNVEYIHCIQMIPFIPISEDLLRPEWVQFEYPVLSPALNDPTLTPEWKAYIIEDFAIIARDSAWNLAQQLPDSAFLKGNSRTNMYWWIATRPVQ